MTRHLVSDEELVAALSQAGREIRESLAAPSLPDTCLAFSLLRRMAVDPDAGTAVQREHPRGCAACGSLLRACLAEPHPSVLDLMRHALFPGEGTSLAASHLALGCRQCRGITASPWFQAVAAAGASATAGASAATEALRWASRAAAALVPLRPALHFAGETPQKLAFRLAAPGGLQCVLRENARGELAVHIEGPDDIDRVLVQVLSGRTRLSATVPLLARAAGGHARDGSHVFGPMAGYRRDMEKGTLLLVTPVE